MKIQTKTSWETGRWALAGLFAALLSACGGGGADGGAAIETARQQTMAAAPASAGGVLINEVHAANWSGATDEDGEVNDWVELYNPDTKPVDLSGYGLSNKSASPFLWVFPQGTAVPAQGYLTVWLSKMDRAVGGAPLHANFNLDNGADTLYLTASNGTAAGIVIDTAKPPVQKADQSWCRMPSGMASAPFAICATPTFNAANSGTANAAMTAKPSFSLASGFYGAAQTVSLSAPAGATIRYTTDGSVPTASSTVYTSPVPVTSSGVVRAVAFVNGEEPSPVETATFIIDAGMATRYAGLKAVFVAMPPADQARFQAFDKNMRSAAHVEMLAAGTPLFKMDAEGVAAGNSGSLDSPQISMNVTARDAFTGAKEFKAALWPEKPGIKATKKFRLRNGSNDWAAAHLRDQLAQSLGGLAVPNIVASSTSVAMFINGQYYGLMDLREREDENLVANNLGVDKDWVDSLYDPLLPGVEIKNGGDAALQRYAAVRDFVVGQDQSVASNYARTAALLNPESLAWDFAHHLFLANHDWPSNNVHVWRTPETDGRWNWAPHDFDFALGRYEDFLLNMNDAYAEGNGEMVANLLRNPDFLNTYMNAVADQMNLMTPTRMNQRLDTLAADMRPYIADFYAKNGLGGEAQWDAQLDKLRQWFANREPVYDRHTREKLNLHNRAAINVAVNDTRMGSVQVNNLDLAGLMSATDPSWTGKYYPGFPIQLTAKPKPGYRFVGWQGTTVSANPRIRHILPSTSPVPADNFSVRWSGQLLAPTSGSYRLQTVSDDGIRVIVNGQAVIDNWTGHGNTVDTSASITLSAGQRVDITVEYFDYTGGATVRLLWRKPGDAAFMVVPADALYPSADATLSGGLTGTYFPYPNLTGAPLATAMENIDFAWGTQPPMPSNARFVAVFEATSAPEAPVINAVANQTLRTGQIVDIPVTASDPGGYAFTFSASSLPKGLAINAATGRIYGRATTPGTYATTLKASNGVATGTLAVTFTVADRPGSGVNGVSPDSGPDADPAATGSGLAGSYFNSLDLSGPVVVQRTEAVDFLWKDAAPHATLPPDFFSARWTGSLNPQESGTYLLRTNSDDGVRVWVDNQLVIDNWTSHGPMLDTSAAVTLTAGQRVSIKVEYQEYGGWAVMQLMWKTPAAQDFAVIPASRLFAN